jgi:hypothetical protein
VDLILVQNFVFAQNRAVETAIAAVRGGAPSPFMPQGNQRIVQYKQAGDPRDSCDLDLLVEIAPNSIAVGKAKHHVTVKAITSFKSKVDRLKTVAAAGGFVEPKMQQLWTSSTDVETVMAGGHGWDLPYRGDDDDSEALGPFIGKTPREVAAGFGMTVVDYSGAEWLVPQRTQPVAGAGMAALRWLHFPTWIVCRISVKWLYW